MGCYELVCVLMSSDAFLCVFGSFGFNWFLWVHMSSSVFLWVSMNFIGSYVFSWVLMAFYGSLCLWVFMDAYPFVEIFVGSNGFLEDLVGSYVFNYVVKGSWFLRVLMGFS